VPEEIKRTASKIWLSGIWAERVVVPQWLWSGQFGDGTATMKWEEENAARS
jgi:hypothetical protein